MKLLFTILFLMTLFIPAKAQDEELYKYAKEISDNNIPLTKLGKDVLWANRTIRIMTLEDKLNTWDHPFNQENGLHHQMIEEWVYFPFFPLEHYNKFFGELLHEKIKAGTLKIADPKDGKTILNVQEVENIIIRNDTVEFMDPISGEYIMEVASMFTLLNTIMYIIIEDWLWDGKKGILHSEVVAIAPVIEEYDLDGNLTGEKPLLWIRFDLQD
ncbi:MAG: hypothetical protein IIA45_03275 [Bacteroidetes bacterium]|nr:hypothetical protein [Bacteroidota bacterium]